MRWSASSNDPVPMKTGWGWILAYGLLLIAVGFLALVNPLATGLATGLVLAVALIAYGIAALISAASAFAHRGRWIELVLGLLALGAGAFVLFAPYMGALSLVWTIGFWLSVSGVFEIISALRFATDRWWRLFLGVIDLVLGLVIAFADPYSSLFFLAMIVGIALLFRGVFFITLAMGLRRLGAVGAAP